MQNKPIHIIILLMLMSSLMASAQRIGFEVRAGDGITILNSPADLNFNRLNNVITANSFETITISLNDEIVSAIGIEAEAGRDITVEVNAPTFLTLKGGRQGEDERINLDIRFAYSNSGTHSETEARLAATEVPAGFVHVTFPVQTRLSRQSNSGLSQSRQYAGRSANTQKIWIFVYGSIGPIGKVRMGEYTAEISVTINYASHE
jgi:spore coat protein U-like protein